ncbi:golgin subfamily A member 1 [Cylas formicarius]|uniref:golgin subfamily A member 1 n=1 Tax=Cylas formicarius TaxID=197179 RepID=UPI0029583EB5|nr:golgin subfamily A member 1 [Cylas formicarius]
MFASLKNKIREETGSDLGKFTTKLTASTVQKIESLRGRSHHGSSSSLNSIVSSDGARDDALVEPDELRKRISKIETDFAKRLDEKEREWRDILKEKDRRLNAVEKERDEAYKTISNLKEALRNAEDLKQKILEHRENTEQMENLQTQELVKIKHLVLSKEQELTEKSNSLREANAQLEKLRSELSRLRRQEEHMSDLQDDLEALRHSSARDLAQLAAQLAKSEQERKYLSDLVVILRRGSSDGPVDQRVEKEKKLLEQRLEEAHLHLADIKTSWSDRIASLETQVGRLSRQAAEEGAERRRAVDERERLTEKVKQLEAELECGKMELTNKETKIRRLADDLGDLSRELKVLRAEREEEVAFLRTKLDMADTEAKVFKKNLENVETELEKVEEENGRLKISVDSEHMTSGSLRQMIVKLEKELSEERANSLNVQKTLSRVTSEKNTALLRNAEVSQQMELVRQNMRRQEGETGVLLAKLAALEEDNAKLNETRLIEEKLNNSVADLREQLQEKNQTIKTLQLRLADLKKTLQQELRVPQKNSAAVLAPSLTKSFPAGDDVNFRYLKHVVLKFLTSREYEAQHLIKAISTLLQFTPEEEKLIQDTIEWKRSWFGAKPKLQKVHKSVHFAS